MATKKKTLQVQFEREEEKINSWRFAEKTVSDAKPKMGKVYLKKNELDQMVNGDGNTLTVTLEMSK